MNNHSPSISDLEAVLREKPDIRAQVSAKGVLNSTLPDALRIKREAIELRKRLTEAKASLDDYAARKAASQKQLADGQKTLDALKQSRKAAAPAKASPKPPVAIVKAPARPSAKAAAPAPAETERDRLHREWQAITDPVQRRTFRLRNWNKLSKQFSNPEPRK